MTFDLTAWPGPLFLALMAAAALASFLLSRVYDEDADEEPARLTE